MAFGITLAGFLSARPVNATGVHPLERAAAESVREKVAKYWNLTPGLAGVKNVHVRIRIRLDRGGRISGEPEVTAKGGPKETQTAVAASAVRAVLRAAPFKDLPQTQFDNETRSVEVILNFEPGDMAL
ncbi:hypothetical protein RHSP_25750 [Rhizobium freirei PRF 81]|uniref:TonB C-terminal domain-containing protein n=1 Tax=Rhizobium freirei PRF 81 TaxID=363754 RepID=N6V068_9HYPH|nr:hypothetical protein [Rhizobium freirei]ENN87295.1 hypothetical protein RHSP_25750 [Rhizobium freirei PRF 81]